MTVSESNETSSTEKFILRALVISLILHLLVYSLWRVGQAQGWWRNFAMPSWMQLVSKAMMPLPPKKPAEELPSQSQLTFVEVDPALATAEPPKKPMFQGAKNTVAANREVKELSVMPNIDGRKQDFLKTTENAKPKAQPAPAPQPTPPPTPAQPQTTPQQNAPKQSFTPGDLAMARPSDKVQQGKTDAETAPPEQAPKQPQPAPERKRTLAEVRAAQSGNYGQPSQVSGGVSRIATDNSLDVKGTPFGDYIGRMVEAVSDHWHKLLEHESLDLTGKVVLRFRLHSDGTVTEVKPLKNDVGDLLEAACERAIKEPAPFGPWSPDMLHAVANDYYDITFTFYYELY